MIKRLLIMVFLLTFFATLWAADKSKTDSAKRATKESSAQLILASVRGFREIDKLGFAWNNTYSDLIYPAKIAWRKGEYGKAENLAKQALMQIKLGREQQKNSVNSGLITK